MIISASNICFINLHFSKSSGALFLARKPDCPENCCHLALGKVLIIVRKGRSDELIISASNICFINLHFSKSSGALFLVGNPNCPGNCGHLAVGKGIGGEAVSNELIISASKCFNSFFFFFKWSRGEDTQHHLKLQSGNLSFVKAISWAILIQEFQGEEC